MTIPQLRLLSRPYQVENHTPLYVDVDSARLWDLVNDCSVHLILRKPALLELARRNDSNLVDYCEQLLSSDDYEKWLTGLFTLSAIGNHDAVDRLILAYAHAINEDRKTVLSIVAKILTAEHVKPFSIMVREVAVPGEIDITGWTRVAISTLEDACRRLSIEPVLVGKLPVTTENRDGEDISLDDLTSFTPPKI
jgi:hypothetical protein